MIRAFLLRLLGYKPAEVVPVRPPTVKPGDWLWDSAAKRPVFIQDQEHADGFNNWPDRECYVRFATHREICELLAKHRVISFDL